MIGLLPEAWPISRTATPAHGHQLVDRLGGVLRTLQNVSVLDVLDHLRTV